MTNDIEKLKRTFGMVILERDKKIDKFLKILKICFSKLPVFLFKFCSERSLFLINK